MPTHTPGDTRKIVVTFYPASPYNKDTKHTHMKTIDYTNNDIRWLMHVDTETREVQVFCDGEKRTYDIDRPIIKVAHEQEYVYIYTDLNIYQFKFEDNKFLVGDILDFDFEHLEEFAMHVFGEDV